MHIVYLVARARKRLAQGPTEHPDSPMKPSLLLATMCLAACALSATLMPVQARAQAGTARPDPVPQLDLPRTTLHAGFHQLEVQVASSPRERQIGLMYRRHMPDHEGMLFVFETPGVQCFWMKNTLIPLTAAFLADDGRIVNLADMQPLDEASHCSREPVRYVLETNQGWFAKKKMEAGQKLGGTLFTNQ